MRHWWFTCNDFTCYVETDENTLVTSRSAPITKRFWGKPGKNLVDYMKRRGGFLFQEYSSDGKKIFAKDTEGAKK